MNQNPKDMLIGKIRKSSLMIGILCVIGTLIKSFMIIANVLNPASEWDHMTRMILFSEYLSFAADAVILLAAAVLFFSMFRSGRPFTPKKIRVVLLIALLLFLKNVVSKLIYCIALHLEFPDMLAFFFLRGGWMEGILFLFAALIMYYASFLQQESDETL